MKRNVYVYVLRNIRCERHTSCLLPPCNVSSTMASCSGVSSFSILMLKYHMCLMLWQIIVD